MEDEFEKLSDFLRSKSIGTTVKRKKCWELISDELIDYDLDDNLPFLNILKIYSINNELEKDSNILFHNANSPYLNDNSIIRWSKLISCNDREIKDNNEIKKHGIKLLDRIIDKNEIINLIYKPEEYDFSNCLILDNILMNNNNNSNNMINNNKKGIESFTTGLNEFAKRNSELYLKEINKENDKLLNCFKNETNKIKNSEAENILNALNNVKIEHIEWVLSIRTEPKNFISENDVIGLFNIKKMLRDKIINPIQRPDLHIGLHSAPRGILLFGPPGTGKTMLAKWIASECKASFYDVSPGSIMSKFYGETENIIKTLFIISEYSAPSIIFIDEIDSIFSKRSNKDDDNNIRLKNQFLQMIDGVQSDMSKIVVVIGATNRPDMLDDAALRRLSKRVLVPLPDLQSRIQQIKHILINNTKGGCQLSDDQLHSIAEHTNGWNGSDIRNLCIKAAEFSYDETIEKYQGIQNVPNAEAFRAITIEDFLLSLKLVKPSYSLENNESSDLIKWSDSFGVI